MRLAMSIDLDLCVGCQACVSACKEQWDSGPGAARDWVHTIETGTRGKDLAVTFYPGLHAVRGAPVPPVARRAPPTLTRRPASSW
jgi:ferredoxin